MSTNYNMDRKVYKNAREWTCKYCNKKFLGRRSLFEHMACCEKRLEKKLDSLGRVISEEGHKKAGETLRKQYEKGECISNFARIEWTSERRAKQAKMMRERHNLNNFCNYSKKACAYIDSLNAKLGWNLQHALNGGEVQVGPYHLDGYDKERNIAFEYDEPKHDRKKYKKHDILRAEYIINKLGCKFYRYNERSNKFYEFRLIPELE